jgi:hypothetical protein
MERRLVGAGALREHQAEVGAAGGVGGGLQDAAHGGVGDNGFGIVERMAAEIGSGEYAGGIGSEASQEPGNAREDANAL